MVPAPRSRPRRFSWTPYATGVAGMAILLGMLAGASIHRERVDQYERASTHTVAMAHLLEASVAGILGEIDAVLTALAAHASDGRTPADLATVEHQMAAASHTTPDIWRWTLCSQRAPPRAVGAPVDDAACHDALVSSATGLQLAGPLRRGAGAPWLLVLSRPWHSIATGARGRVVAELPVESFRHVFGDLQLGPLGAASLRTAQLGLVYRHPMPPDRDAEMGRANVSTGLREAHRRAPLGGQYETPTRLDGVPRLVAYRRLREYPLYVLVGLPSRDYPRGWNVLDLSVLVLAGATVLLALLSALALYHSSQRRVIAAARRFDALVATSNDAIVSKTLQGRVTSWNAAAERIFGWTAEQMIGESIGRLFPPERAGEEDEMLLRVQQGEQVHHFDTERLHADGHRIPVALTISPVLDGAGRIVGASMIARDISRQKALEAELRSLAFHDALTQLPNRRLFLDRLRHAQEASRRSHAHAGVLFVDLDHFKCLNDRHGHDVGDLMLVEVARRLRASVREHDTVARLGGDEFVVLCEHLGPDPAEAQHALEQMADKLDQVLAQDFRLGELEWHYGASIGHRLFLGTQEAPDALLRDADRVMYEHKEQRHTTRSGELLD